MVSISALGLWVVGHHHLNKVGGKLWFAICRILNGDTFVFTADAIFSVMPKTE